MSILDKLKTLFEGKFGDIFANNTIKLFDFSKNVSNVLELKDGQKLSLDVSKATSEEKKKIKKEIIDVMVQNQDEALFLDKSEQKTNQIKRNLPVNNDEELLKFYKDKLNPNMFKALETSIVVRNSWKKGEDITELKRDIAWKYPSFGNNLCNLVTRNYFEKYFKELYEKMLEQDDFSIVIYQQEVERIVESLPYMVFINRHKSYEEFSGEVKFKIDRLKKYGTEKLKIHALGKDNVDKALKIVDEYKEDKTIVIERRLNQSKTIITATFIFR
ncbi:MAG: hypothetical protein U9Q69_00265 [Nanoarchaeota archaeon]|nr:hypothetical protein [Nanoarchaeota archaeon]